MADEARFSWQELPDGSLGDDRWSAFKNDAHDEFLTLIQQADRDFASEPSRRLERIRQLRREHHLIAIADRVRKSSPCPGELSGRDLRKAAEFILDRGAYISASGHPSTKPRDISEENMVLSARVSWHKIMRRAGSPAESRGGWRARKTIRGNAAILRKISARGLTPENRAEILREHIEEKVEQLLRVAREVVIVGGCKLPRQDRLIIRELEGLLVRTQWAKRRQRSPGESLPERSDLRSAMRRAAASDDR
jgi:hypothetical protein